ncbi:MAG TPA: META domain-containing protein [Gemmatimonadaceae bacterium]|nr:META domain-containing protein [Gemmatimonadaceae bacterium]
MPEGVPLLGTHWTVTEVHSAPVGPTANEPYIQLAADGKTVSGSGGCNRLTGQSTVAGDSLRFGPMAQTRMACATGMDQEQAITSALALATRYRIQGNTLQLFAGDQQVMRLVAQSGGS